MTQNELLSEELRLHVERLIKVGLRQSFVEFTAFFAGMNSAADNSKCPLTLENLIAEATYYCQQEVSTCKNSGRAHLFSYLHEATMISV